MIIDAHVHIGKMNLFNLSITFEEAICLAKKLKIDKRFCTHLLSLFYDFKEGLAKFCTDKRYVYRYNNCGFINTKGEVVIKPQFDYAQDFSEGLAVVKILDEENIVPRPKWAIEYGIKGDIKKGKYGYFLQSFMRFFKRA